MINNRLYLPNILNLIIVMSQRVLLYLLFTFFLLASLALPDENGRLRPFSTHHSQDYWLVNCGQLFPSVIGNIWTMA